MTSEWLASGWRCLKFRNPRTVFSRFFLGSIVPTARKYGCFG